MASFPGLIYFLTPGIITAVIVGFGLARLVKNRLLRKGEPCRLFAIA